MLVGLASNVVVLVSTPPVLVPTVFVLVLFLTLFVLVLFLMPFVLVLFLMPFVLVLFLMPFVLVLFLTPFVLVLFLTPFILVLFLPPFGLPPPPLVGVFPSPKLTLPGGVVTRGGEGLLLLAGGEVAGGC